MLPPDAPSVYHSYGVLTFAPPAGSGPSPSVDRGVAQTAPRQRFPPPMGECHDGPHDGNPRAQGRPAGGDPGAQIPATPDPGPGGSGRPPPPDGAAPPRARCAPARPLRRALHGRDAPHAATPHTRVQ